MPHTRQVINWRSFLVDWKRSRLRLVHAEACDRAHVEISNTNYGCVLTEWSGISLEDANRSGTDLFSHRRVFVTRMVRIVSRACWQKSEFGGALAIYHQRVTLAEAPGGTTTMVQVICRLPGNLSLCACTDFPFTMSCCSTPGNSALQRIACPLRFVNCCIVSPCCRRSSTLPRMGNEVSDCSSPLFIGCANDCRS